MARLHCTFLVRCWQLGDGAQRFEIEQIRSGERMVVSSAAAAVAWISEYTANAPAERPVLADGASPGAGAAGSACEPDPAGGGSGR